ncbi:fimbrial protein [Kalamiella sp. sgz302252]|uniref:fimbrial protein n=1 Tax=Pantoea sp. sgz302252 TaxID=3341827 RepID=UPI0036D23825
MHNFKLTMCALALGLCSSLGYAADERTTGTVEFNGELIDETCVIDDSVLEPIQVPLPKLSTKTLLKSGDEAGSTHFDIKVSGCPAEITKVAAHFEAISGSALDASTGNLINDAADTEKAKNVEVRLYNADQKQLILGSTGASFEVDGTTHEATLRYYGGYYATGATTSGKVHAKAKYTLSYP